VSTALSQLGCQRIAVDITPVAPSPSVMPDALPVATLTIYLGMGPAHGTAGSSPSDFGSP